MLFNDGKPPFFHRYSINSSAVDFQEWESFPDPNIQIEHNRQLKKEENERKKFQIDTKIKLDQDVKQNLIENKDKFL